MTIQEKCSFLAERVLPRILSQISRDENSPDYGCCDRNHHHYKIRDFSSIIIQQAGYAAWCASALPCNKWMAKGLQKTAAACCSYWNRQALRFRAFEEYYPWEEGYPPVAFSTLAVAKLAAEGCISPDAVKPGLSVAARQLLTRFEAKAANQQTAGMAALCQIRKLFPEMVPEDRLEEIIAKTLQCQHPEGWFMEYGGQDLGYLSVTMDCLWDAFDASEDVRFHDSAASALKYIDTFLSLSPRGIGMHNARNTDYIVPYGIARFLEEPLYSGIAARILTGLLQNADCPGHFFWAVDDRYWCHYIGHSLFRAIPLLNRLDSISLNVPEERNLHLAGTDHYLRMEKSPFRALISGKKGGIMTLWDDAGRSIPDFGWVVPCGKKLWVNHWWSDSWKSEQQGNMIRISGTLSCHGYMKNTPFRHFALRCLSLVFGHRIIAFLKEKMIFKKNSTSPFSFCREIIFESERVIVRDEFSVPDGCTPRPAGRASQRHVASADSFHFEDFCNAEPLCSITCTETVRKEQGKIFAERIYVKKLMEE